MIRFGTFETNSSSAHTFVLRSDTNYTTDIQIQEYIDSVKENYPEIPDGYIPTSSYSGDGDYGRGFAMLYEWHEKMSYILASCKYEPQKRNMIIDIIKKRTGCKGVAIPFYPPWDRYDDEPEPSVPCYDLDDYAFDGFGSVDHQSYDNVDNALSAIRKSDEYKTKTDEEIFFDMIFNNKFIIVVDSDESYHFDSMIENGMVETNLFTHILEYHSSAKDGKYSFDDFEEYSDKIIRGGY